METKNLVGPLWKNMRTERKLKDGQQVLGEGRKELKTEAESPGIRKHGEEGGEIFMVQHNSPHNAWQMAICQSPPWGRVCWCTLLRALHLDCCIRGQFPQIRYVPNYNKRNMWIIILKQCLPQFSWIWLKAFYQNNFLPMWQKAMAL